ncbi:Ig-like domain-containing protein [Roseateles sp. L2-2]|uniref:Ig-like domain-containing protein n=1 Tax=Roseateles sp. L2-2 TaxID=3422597 RepID=UPI003D35D429
MAALWKSLVGAAMLAGVVGEAQAGCYKDGRETICSWPYATISAPGGAVAPAGGSFQIKVLGSEDSQNTLQLIYRVELHRNDVPIALQEFSPNTKRADATFTQSGLAPGVYTFRGKVYDAGGRTTMSVPIQVRVNAPPSVGIGPPFNGSVIAQSPADIAVSGTASDDAGIQRIEVYADGNLAGTASASPFSVFIPGVGAGVHRFFARAYDSDGAWSDSATTTIRVNASPSVAMSTPANGSVIAGPSGSVRLTATASDSDSGGIAWVQYLTTSGSNIGSASAAPFEYVWSGVAPGTYDVVARVVDADGGMTTSGAVRFRVNALPSVALASPANNQVFAGPTASIPLSAGASDGDGSVQRVEFYANGSHIGTSTSAPFAMTWPGVGAGGYTIVARAVDNDGGVRDSAGVYVRVNALPSASMTGPANGTVLAGSSVRLTASASDSDTGIARVEFYSGGAHIGSATAAPYEMTWSGLSAGTYSVIARAVDHDGGIGDSSPISLRVNALPAVSMASPANGAVLAGPTTSVRLTAAASDSDSSGIGRVEYYSTAGPHIGTATAAPYEFIWPGIPSGTHGVVARAVDTDGGVTTSAPTVFRVNALPTVTLASPANNQVFSGPTASIAISAGASDGDGSVQRVEFYANGSHIGTSTSAPFAMSWPGVGAGGYTIIARAVDNDGGYRDSVGVYVRVNALPTASMTGPANGTVVAGSSVRLTASASDSDTGIARVEFYSGGVPIGSATAAPYEMTWGGLSAGTYAVIARAVDHDGGIGDSSAISFRVNALPSAALTSPANNQVFISGPASVPLAVNVADADGSVQRVEFYANGAHVGTSTSAPFAMTWSGVGAGAYTIVARAVDNDGGIRDSASVSIIVNASPTVSLTAPASGAVLADNSSPWRLTATASDPDGSIARVEFLVDGQVAGTATSSPFAWDWPTPAPGAHRLAARAIDNVGGSTTSGEISVRVNAPPNVTLTSPTAGAVHPGPTSTITLAATATDDSGIQKVEFLSGDSVIATLTAAPYQFSWPDRPAGAYVLSARATDGDGRQATSAAVAVVVTHTDPVAVTIVPPNLAGGITGTAAGQASVSSKGSATYELPIALPPGTAGQVPSVTLHYDSQAKEGLSGLGWDVSGLSRITRCAATIATDGERNRARMDKNTRYCLDGQRLIVVSGVEGASATYRTEIDHFSRITSYGSDAERGPDSWKVELKSGDIQHFGTTPDSFVDTPGSAGKALFWALSREEDRRGNYIAYDYFKDSGTGEHLPKAIRYTGNGTAFAPYAALRFEYDNAARPDPSFAYLAGARTVITKRLTGLSTWTGIAGDGTGGALARRWAIAYETSTTTGLSLVQSVSDCGPAECLPATSFQYSKRSAADNTFTGGTWAGGPEVLFKNPAQRGLPKLLEVMSIADLNGDGKSDLLQHLGGTSWQVCLSTGSAFSCSTWTGPDALMSQLVTGDFNGDGRTDLLKPSSGTAGSLLCLSTGTGFNCQPSTRFPASPTPDVAQFGVTNNFVVADANGDGRDDVVVRGTGPCLSDGTNFTCTYTGGAGGFFDPYAYRYFEAPTEASCTISLTRWRPFMGDFNGDGKTDALTATVYNPNCSRMWETTPDNSFQMCSASGDGCRTAVANLGLDTGFAGQGASMTGDFNGDGITDFALSGLKNATVLKVCYGNGAGGTDCRDYTNGATPDEHAFSTVADIDGDGRPELLGIGANGRLCRIAGGQLRCESRAFTLQHTTTVYGDFNGDGRMDIAQYNPDAKTWGVYLAGAAPVPDLMTSVTNGVGQTSTFGYSALNDATVHAQGGDPGYPKRNVQSGAPVVTRLQVGNGQGGSHVTTYRYEGMRAELTGRGSLGFAATERTDTLKGLKTRSVYSQDYPTIGQVTAETITHTNGVEMSSRSVEWESMATTAGGATKHVFQRSTMQATTDLNGAAMLANTVKVPDGGIDAFGNVKSIVQTMTSALEPGVSYVTSTTRTFDTLEDRWLIGQMRTEATTATAPGAVAVTRTTAREYDALGGVWRETVEPDAPELRVITELGRHPIHGGVTSKTITWRVPGTPTDRSLVVETTEYDAVGRFPEVATNAKAHVERRVFDAAHGQPLLHTDVNQQLTQWSYDAWGRKTRESRPDGTATSWAYRSCVAGCLNNAISTIVTQQWTGTQQTATPVEELFDALNRKVLTRSWGFSGTEVLTENRYDTSGYLQSLSRPYYAGAAPVWTHRDRDAIGRLKSLRAPDDDGVEATTTYAYNGLEIKQTDAKQQTTTRVANALGKVSRVVDALGRTTRYGYDGFGHLLKVTDAKSNVIDVTVDRLGRKTVLRDPDLGTWNYKVDPLGRTYSQTDAKGQTTLFEFDDLNRTTRRLAPDQDSRWVFDTALNGVGKLDESYNWANSTKDARHVFTYDAKGRPESQTFQLDGDYQEVYRYDTFGRPAGTVYRRSARGGTGGATNTIGLHYNELGYAASVSVAGGGLNTTVWQGVARNAEGNDTKEFLSGGLIQHTGYSSFTGRLSSVITGTPTRLGAPNATHQNDVYLYDTIGNLRYRAQMTDSGSLLQENFTYDALNRLEDVTLNGVVSSTRYDEIGSLSSKSNVGTYSYPASGAGSVRPHAVTSIAGTVAGIQNPTFSYDDNGNLVQGLNRGYTWMAGDVPRTIDRLSGGVSVERTSFVYGPDQERRLQTVQPMSGGTPGAATTTIYYAGAQERQIEAAQNVTIVRTQLPMGLGYIEERLPGTSADLAAAGTRVVRMHLKDHLGSVLGVVDGSGNVLQRMSYDAWGRRRQTNGVDDNWASLGTIANNQDNSGYTGHEHLDQLGLVHMNARLYDPILGRHTSADPTVPDPQNGQGLNRYSYVLNNALAFTDPTGLSPTSGNSKLWDRPPSISRTIECHFRRTCEENMYSSSSETSEGSAEQSQPHFFGVLGAPPRLALRKYALECLVVRNDCQDAIRLDYSIRAQEQAIGNFDKEIIENIAIPLKAMSFAAIVLRIERTAVKDLGKYSVGQYNELAGVVKGLDAHHVGQKALLGKLIPGYDPLTAPAILVPKIGHTLRGPNGILSRSVEGLTTPRDVLARDIRELRRVYQDVPNSSLQKLIKMNKEAYPGSF